MQGTKSNATVRLFLALWPDAPVREALAAHRQQWQWPPAASLVAPERLHLTLHFIGDVEAARVQALQRALAVRFAPFLLSLDGACARLWPGGIAVLELAAPEPLQRLHERLGQALRASGLPPEARTFRPHVTLARKAAGAHPGPAAPSMPWPVNAFALVRSTPGLGYRTLHAYAST